MEDLTKQKELLLKYIEQLDEDNAIAMSEKLLKEGLEPLSLLRVINKGMYRVGKRYEEKDYYIADLIMAGLIFKEVLELGDMTAHFQSDRNKKIGKVIVGTVKGDIHDIGKDIFRGMLESNGFEVIDLGVDVPKEAFLKKVEETNPDIVALSGILTVSAEPMKEVVEAFREKGIRDKYKIMVGGSYLTEGICNYIGADNYATDASFGVKLCREWVNSVDKRGNNDE